MPRQSPKRRLKKMGSNASRPEADESRSVRYSDYFFGNLCNADQNNESREKNEFQCCRDTSMPSSITEIFVKRTTKNETDDEENPYKHRVDGGFIYPETPMRASNIKRRSQKAQVHLCETLATTLSTLSRQALRQAFDIWYAEYTPERAPPSPMSSCVFEEVKEDDVEEAKEETIEHVRHHVHDGIMFRGIKKVLCNQDTSNVSEDWHALAISFPWSSQAAHGQILLQKLVMKLGDDDELLEPNADTKKTILWHAVLKNDIVGVTAVCQAVKDSDIHPEDVLEWLHMKDRKARLTPAELAHKRSYTKIYSIIQEMDALYKSEDIRFHQERKRRRSSIQKFAHNIRMTTVKHHKIKQHEAAQKRHRILQANQANDRHANYRRGLSGFLMRRDRADKTY